MNLKQARSFVPTELAIRETKIIENSESRFLEDNYFADFFRDRLESGMPLLQNNQIEIARLSYIFSTVGDIVSFRLMFLEDSVKISVASINNTEFSLLKSEFKSIPSQGEFFDLIQQIGGDVIIESNGESGELYHNNDHPYLITAIQEINLTSIEDILEAINLESNIYPNLNLLLTAFLKKEGFE